MQPLLQLKTVSITCSEGVFVALGIQHAMRMRRTVSSSVVCLVLPYFCTLYHKQYDFRKQAAEPKIVCFDFL